MVTLSDRRAAAVRRQELRRPVNARAGWPAALDRGLDQARRRRHRVRASQEPPQDGQLDPRPRATVVIFDAANPYESAQVQGIASIEDDPDGTAVEELSHKYTGGPYPGFAGPNPQWVTARITADKVTTSCPTHSPRFAEAGARASPPCVLDTLTRRRAVVGSRAACRHPGSRDRRALRLGLIVGPAWLTLSPSLRTLRTTHREVRGQPLTASRRAARASRSVESSVGSGDSSGRPATGSPCTRARRRRTHARRGGAITSL